MSSEFDLDDTIDKLTRVKDSKPGTEVNLPEEDIIWLCRASREVRCTEYPGLRLCVCPLSTLKAVVDIM